MYLARFPRVRLAALPTVLEPLPRLTRMLGGQVEIWIKRDDNTGLALGGNKARKLEYLLAEAVEQGCDTLITTGGPQSNHCRMTAAAAAKAGLACHLVLTSRSFDLRQGNLLLDELLGAELHFCPSVEDIPGEMSKIADQLTQAGHHPYQIPLGGSTAIGAMGYVAAVRELTQQLEGQSAQFAAFVHATGSGGTQAGLVAGALLHQLPAAVLGVSVSRPAHELAPKVDMIVQDIYRAIGIPVPMGLPIEVDDRFVGRGYGIPTPESGEALQLLAKTEGIIIDPVYTAKAMAGLIQAVRDGRWPTGSQVLFWHTGGSPALFADQIFWEVAK